MNRRVLVIAACVAALAGVALLEQRSTLENPVDWTPDGLFYQARLLEMRGVDSATAMHTVFEGPMSAKLRARDEAHTGNPRWVKYNEQFYGRRVALPLAGAWVYPVAGDRSLIDLSVAGYVAAV